MGFLARLSWPTPECCEVDGLTFFLDNIISRPSAGTSFGVEKTRTFLERYQSLLLETPVRRLLEFGFWEGGSIVLFQKLLAAEKCVGVDHSPRRPDLDESIARAGLTDRVRLHYETNQADASAVHKILGAEFGSEPLDLVIDDASHRLEETRSSFNIAFPWLAPGGWYVIEDWWWEYGCLATPEMVRDAGRLSTFVIELVKATRFPDSQIISELVVNECFVAVRKASGFAPEAFFDIRLWQPPDDAVPATDL